MQDTHFRVFAYSVLSISSALTILSIFQATGLKISLELELFLIIIWAISPYLCMYLVDVLLRRVYAISNMSLFLTVSSFAMLLFTLTYFDSGGRKSSTDALKYLFAPFFLHIIWFAAFEIATIWTLFWKLNKRMKNTKLD
jgi:hypothetical protein